MCHDNFSYTCSPFGYVIKYKGQNVKIYHSLNTGKSIGSNLKSMKKKAERKLNDIVNGKIERDVMDNIKLIDEDYSESI